MAKASAVASKKPSNIDRFIALSDAEKTAAVAKYDRGPFPYAKTSALTAAERRHWAKSQAELKAGHKAAPRAAGRPKVGRGTKSVLVSVERGLLKQADAYAKTHGLKRTQLVAAGLRLAMANGVTADNLAV